MKNEKIHDGLEEKDLRDYFANEIRKCDHALGSETYIASMQIKIAKLQEQIDRERRYAILHQLIKERNWVEVDVSDEIEDYNPNTYLPFIGTPEEAQEIFTDTSVERA
jgi:hypothetical protein